MRILTSPHIQMPPKKKELISEELMSDIANYYSPVYKFISSRFDVQEKWKSINLLKN